MVKADAYGHGAVVCARALEPDVWGLAVSLVEEGVELRRGGIAAPVVVLGGVYGRAHQDVVAFNLTPVVSEADDLERFARAAAELAAPPVSVHLKVDTGMSRLGASPSALPALFERARQIPGVVVRGLMTHLAEADGEDEAPTRAQLAVFAAARAELARLGLGPVLLHVSNTAGAARFADARFDLVRPGIALFGGVPAPRIAIPGLEPVLRLSSRIVALRDVPVGAGVSYGAAFRATRPTRIATIPIGYADGYSRRLSAEGQVLVAGRRCRIAGNVTMDMTMVDVTDVPAERGDEVVLIGAQRGPAGEDRIALEELAAWSGTISWEICCGISKRVPRVYSDRA